jgi:hypothetical protein
MQGTREGVLFNMLNFRKMLQDSTAKIFIAACLSWFHEPM